MKYPLILFLPLLLVHLPADELRETFLGRARAPQTEAPLRNAEGGFSHEVFFRTAPGQTAALPLLGRPEARFPVVELNLNGHAVLAIVDTGAATSMLSLRAAVRTGAAPLGDPPQQIRVTGFGGDGIMTPAVIQTLEAEGVTVEKVPVLVPAGQDDLPVLPRIGDRQVEMLLGFDFMRNLNWIDFDQPQGRITFSTAPQEEDGPAAQAAVPMTIRPGHGPQVTARLQETFPLTLDTGGHFGLRLPPSVAGANDLHAPLFAQPTARRSATGASATLPAGRVTLHIGPLSLQQLPAELPHGGAEAAERIGALLGNPVLSRMRWRIDFDAETVSFFP